MIYLRAMHTQVARRADATYFDSTRASDSDEPPRTCRRRWKQSHNSPPQLPESDLCGTSGRASNLSLLDVTCPITPIMGVAHKAQRRTKFLREEDGRFAKLKEQKQPELLWQEINMQFPRRTVNSFQVHYRTQLKGRGLSNRRACSRSELVFSAASASV